MNLIKNTEHFSPLLSYIVKFFNLAVSNNYDKGAVISKIGIILLKTKFSFNSMYNQNGD